MLKKKIKYTDFNDRPREEEFYFNLTKAELLEIEMSTKDGLEETLNRIAMSKNGGEMIALFKSVLAKAYLEVDADGRVHKSAERFEAFSHTEAYSELVMEIMTDADKLAEFIAHLVRGSGISPADVRAQIDKGMEAQGYSTANVFEKTEPAAPTGPREPVRGPRTDPDQPPLFTV